MSYVDVASVVSRLNEACDAWDFHIDRYEVRDEEVLVQGRLVADGVTKCAFGGSSITVDKQGKAVSIPDDLKSAASDALKKGASLLGVGLELYGGQVPPRTATRTSLGSLLHVWSPSLSPTPEVGLGCSGTLAAPQTARRVPDGFGSILDPTRLERLPGAPTAGYVLTQQGQKRRRFHCLQGKGHAYLHKEHRRRDIAYQDTPWPAPLNQLLP